MTVLSTIPASAVQCSVLHLLLLSSSRAPPADAITVSYVISNQDSIQDRIVAVQQYRHSPIVIAQHSGTQPAHAEPLRDGGMIGLPY